MTDELEDKLHDAVDMDTDAVTDPAGAIMVVFSDRAGDPDTPDDEKVLVTDVVLKDDHDATEEDMIAAAQAMLELLLQNTHPDNEPHWRRKIMRQVHSPPIDPEAFRDDD